MATYVYVATKLVGKKKQKEKKVKGKLQGTSPQRARYELVEQGLEVISLRKRKKFTEIQMTKKKTKPQEIAGLSRQLSAFLRAGIPIIRAIDTIAAETKDKVLREILPEMSAQLSTGDTLSEALANHVEHFPSYFPGIIRSAELSGNIDIVLDQLADYIDRDTTTRRKVKSAMMYPSILGAMSVATVGILIGFVLPKFKTFFIGFNAKLPLTTRMLLGLGTFVSKSGMKLGVAIVVIVVLFVMFARTEYGRLTRNRLALKTPAIKGVVEAAVIERFCRILAAMVNAGIPISAGMTAAIDSTDNRVFRTKLVTASEQMLEGRGFATPIADTGLFPGMVTQMMRVGEDTGTLDNQLTVCAGFYERELSFKLTKLTSLFEPLIIVVMGGIVGFVAVALVQAMYGVYGQSGMHG
ncbi:MAG: type pilus assembly protein PilC [Actinomycetota bacterium]|jgi:type IV pilus assembly protein PilC|nr:type pilus assembly protein PilC [Actinomycetota bacterium]